MSRNFYRGDGDGDKNNIEGKYDKDGNPIGDTKEEPADGGAADGGGDKGGDATNPDPDSFGEGGTDDNNVVSVFNGKSFLRRWPLEVSSTVSITLILW